MAPWLLLALTASAPAADGCDARALTSALKAAPPARVADAYVKLASCDAAAAKRYASELADMVGDSDANEALVAALKVGADQAVRTWITSAEPDVQSRAVRAIGQACPDVPAVGDFFVGMHGELGDRFFNERWHAGLNTCRTPAVRALLAEALDSRTVGRPSKREVPFVSILEVYARNAGAGSIPTIVGWLEASDVAADEVMLVNVLGDAANVGGMAGMDEAAAQLATSELVRIAPTLTPKGLDTADRTLRAMGSTSQADALTAVRYSSALVTAPNAFGEQCAVPGTKDLVWGVAAVEDLTCKNGKARTVLHLGCGWDAGADTPRSQIVPATERTVTAAWSLPTDGRCKATSNGTTFEVSALPLGDAKALRAWIEERTKAFEPSCGDGCPVVAEDGFGY